MVRLEAKRERTSSPGETDEISLLPGSYTTFLSERLIRVGSELPLSILLVDDEPVGLRALVSVFADQGYDLVLASTGAEAISCLEQRPFDLMLLDLMMPRMDGFEVCRTIRAMPAVSGIPIIVLTACDDRDNRLEALRSGADDLLSKPVDRSELRLRVQSILKLNRFRRLRTETYRSRTLAQQLGNSLGHLDLLREVDRVIQYAPNLRESGRNVLTSIRKLVPFDHAAVIRLEDQGNWDGVLAEVGDSQPLTDLNDQLEESLSLDDLVSFDDSCLMHEIGSNWICPPIERCLRDAGIREVLTAPVKYGSRVLGLMILGRVRVSHFNETATAILQDVARRFGAPLMMARERQQA